MIREVKFESQNRRMAQILACLNKHGIASIEEANQICDAAGLDPYKTCEETQMICFENAKWAYVVGSAIALKEKAKNAVEAANYIGEGLQSFCIPGSVADDRKVGIGHGELAARLLEPETKCFAFLVFVFWSRRQSALHSFCCSGGCNQDCPDGKQIQTCRQTSPLHPQRTWKGCGYDNLPHKRFHICSDRVRLLYRRA